MTTNKLILIDGSSLLSTSFYGNLPQAYYFAKTEEERETVLKKVMQTSTGVYTNGVYTMCKILLNIINKQKPTHLVVAWDKSRNTFRRKLYKDYKAHREDTKPELKSQFILAQRVLDAMDIAQFVYEEYEADDIIGTLAEKFEEEISTYIITKDQDALQLVSDNTRLWLITSKSKEMYQELGIDIKECNIPDNVFEFTPDYVKEFYGLSPIQIIDKKALEGDKSDNIPGVKGVGEKAVIPLLQEFGTIENLYANIENLCKQEEKEIKELIKSLGISRSPLSYLLKEPTEEGEIVGKEAAFLSKKLATIDTQIEELAELRLEDVVLEFNKEGMTDIFKELEFKSLLSE